MGVRVLLFVEELVLVEKRMVLSFNPSSKELQLAVHASLGRPCTSATAEQRHQRSENRITQQKTGGGKYDVPASGGDMMDMCRNDILI